MEWKFLVPMVAVFINIVLAGVRVYAGPSVFDRILGANMVGTKTILLVAVSGFFFGRPEWLDLALVYALMNFIGIFAVMRYAKFGSLVLEKKVRHSD